jgi:hypothetical protein
MQTENVGPGRLIVTEILAHVDAIDSVPEINVSGCYRLVGHSDQNHSNALPRKAIQVVTNMRL